MDNPDSTAGELLKDTLEKIRIPDQSIAVEAQKKLDNLTKPRGSLGRLEEIARQMTVITGNLKPVIEKKAIIVMAGDHGIVKEGVSAYPQEVTGQMVYNFLNGGAAINVLARHIGAEVLVVDTGVISDLKDHPSLLKMKISKGTSNMLNGPAMTREQAIRSVEAGIYASEKMIKDEFNIIATGEMGIGNTTSSSAITSVICGIDPLDVTGYGTGLDEIGFKNKIAIIRKILLVNNPDRLDGLDILSKIGGFEIGGIAGVILGCAANKIPVVIDGFISSSGALLANCLNENSKYYMIPSHCSVEKGHRIALSWLGLKPLFDFDMRLGEGTGAALGISIVEASLKIFNEMATFGDSGVSDKDT